MIIIPADTMNTKIAKSLGFTTLLSIIMEGSDKAVTAIINDNTVPTPTPFANNASAIGRVPNISAYIGMPTTVASNTANGLLPPTTFSMID